MPTTPAAYAPNDYEVAHAKRVLARHEKATGAKPTARAAAARNPAPQPSRFAHLKPAAVAERPRVARIVSPSVSRAEKAAADRLDHADLARHGRVLSAAERQAADADADEVVKLAGLR